MPGANLSLILLMSAEGSVSKFSSKRDFAVVNYLISVNVRAQLVVVAGWMCAVD